MALSARIVFFFLIIIFVAAGCKNEPFEDPDLLTASSVLTVDPKAKTRIQRTFTYQSDKLLTSGYSGTGVATTSQKFYYDGNNVRLIVADSSKMTRKETTLSYSELKVFTVTSQIDRIARLDTPTQKRDTINVSKFLSERTIEYVDQHPAVISIKTYAADGKSFTETRTDLTWENGNVTRQVINDVTAGKLIQDVTITYNDKTPAFAAGIPYELIIEPKEFFWLSNNNPITFTEGGTTVEYSYNYNKFGYPNDVTGDNGVTVGFAYARLK